MSRWCTAAWWRRADTSSCRWRRTGRRRPRQCVDRERGKPASTRWQLLDADAQTSRLLLQPLTGRTHQLRVHLCAIGHPIVGDVLYAPSGRPTERMLLHASELQFAHPSSGEMLTLRSAAPF